jgi:hypothetical protein
MLSMSCSAAVYFLTGTLYRFWEEESNVILHSTELVEEFMHQIFRFLHTRGIANVTQVELSTVREDSKHTAMQAYTLMKEEGERDQHQETIVAHTM